MPTPCAGGQGLVEVDGVDLLALAALRLRLPPMLSRQEGDCDGGGHDGLRHALVDGLDVPLAQDAVPRLVGDSLLALCFIAPLLGQVADVPLVEVVVDGAVQNGGSSFSIPFGNPWMPHASWVLVAQRLRAADCGDLDLSSCFDAMFTVTALWS